MNSRVDFLSVNYYRGINSDFAAVIAAEFNEMSRGIRIFSAVNRGV